MTAMEALDRTILLCRDYVADSVTDEEIARAFQSLRVMCIADTANLSCHSAQTALVTLVSLLSRMGSQVGLAIPDVAILGPQPPIYGHGLLTALSSASGRLMLDAEIVSADSRFSPDIIFILGGSGTDRNLRVAWRLSGTEWSGSISPASLATAPTWTAEWPIGGIVSALLAANEAFKYVIRRLTLRQHSDAIFFESTRRCSWDFGTAPLPPDAVDLGNVDFVSAGAITQGALYSLARVPHVQIHGRILDDDFTAISNLNRNLLTTVEDVNERKVSVIASRCNKYLDMEPVALRFLSSADTNIQLASRIVIGVDDIPSRWAVQLDAPGWVGVAGTSHFSISSSSHLPGMPCSGCLHPVDDPVQRNAIPTVGFVSLWAGLSVAVRLIREALHNPYPPDRQHLWLTPLRLEKPHAAMWSPVHPSRNCPVRCTASLRAS